MFSDITTYAPVEVDSHKKHKGTWMGLANKEVARQLKVCTQEFIQWAGGTENPVLPSEDLAEMAWTCGIVGKCLG